MISRPGPDDESAPGTPGGPAVERIIERFGGIRPMASKLDIPVTTVQGWKKRGAIPVARHADLRAAASRYKIPLDDADLVAATPADEQVVDPPPPLDVTISATEGVVPAEPVGTAEPQAALDSTIDTGTAEAGATWSGTPNEPEAPRAEERVLESPNFGSPNFHATPVAAPAPQPARSGGGFATAVSLLALIVGAAALSEPWWGPRVPGWPQAGSAVTMPAAAPAPAPTSDPALADRLQQLAARLDQLEQRGATADTATAAAPTGDGQALAARLDELEQRLASAAGSAPAIDTAPLQDSLNQLTGRLDGLEQRSAQQGEQQQRTAELAQRLEGLEQKLSQVGESAGAAQALEQEVGSVKQEVGSVKQQIASVNEAVKARSDSAAAAQALVLAAGQLRNTLAGGQPFQSDLQAVRGLGIGDPQVTQPLDTLAPFAAKGIPTQPQLADRFKPLASEIVRADNKGDARDWIDQVKGTLSTLVTVRQEGGGAVGTGPSAVVARAEAALQEGNLAAAVQELSTLEGPAAGAAAGWLEDARARLAANQASQQLSSRAISLMSSAAGATGAEP